MPQYKQIIVIGHSQLATKCAEIAARSNPEIRIRFFNIRGERPPKAADELDNLEYACFEKSQIMDELRNISQKVLVFSIMNFYLFPADVIANPALTLINLHHALLPNHPGRNAEVWAIFEGDNVAGITWHMVTTKVEAGEIVLQQQVKITEHMTAFMLFRALNEISLQSFPKVLYMAISGEIKTYPQPSDIQYTLRYAKEKPADGVLDLEWNIDQMYRFVRAMDYGILKLMGEPIVIIDGKKYIWKKYVLDSISGEITKEVEVLLNEIRIRKNGKELHLMGIKLVD